MPLKRIETNQRVSQAVEFNGVVITAGQVAFDAPGASIKEQTLDTLKHIDALLEKAGTNKRNLISATIWLADMSDYDEMNKVWDNWVPNGHAPTRVCVESRIADPSFSVEIAMTAIVE